MVSRRIVSGTDESVRQLMIAVLDSWKKIKYYHQLVEIECSETEDSMVFYVDCYLTLSEPYRNELELKLEALREEFSG